MLLIRKRQERVKLERATGTTVQMLKHGLQPRHDLSTARVER